MQYYAGLTLEMAEKIVIEGAYRYYGNNKSVTAQALQISVRTLDTKLEKYKAEAEDKIKKEAVAQAKREADLKRQMGIAPQFSFGGAVNNIGMVQVLLTNESTTSNKK